MRQEPDRRWCLLAPPPKMARDTLVAEQTRLIYSMRGCIIQDNDGVSVRVWERTCCRIWAVVMTF